MEFIEKFGIDWKLLIAQGVNFAIVLLVLWKFAYKPILKMLHDREKTIDQSLKNADRVEALKQEMEVEKKAVLTEAKKEAQVIMQDAQKKIEQNRQIQLDKTKSEIAELVSKAKQEITQEKTKAMKAAERELGAIAVSVAEKLIRRELKAEDQERLVADTVKEIGTLWSFLPDNSLNV